MSVPVIKLLNFFERFHEACKGKKHDHKLMDIMQEVLVCDSEDEVFAAYPMISNQVKFAFDFLEKNTRQTPEKRKRYQVTFNSQRIRSNRSPALRENRF